MKSVLVSLFLISILFQPSCSILLISLLRRGNAYHIVGDVHVEGHLEVRNGTDDGEVIDVVRTISSLRDDISELQRKINTSKQEYRAELQATVGNNLCISSGDIIRYFDGTARRVHESFVFSHEEMTGISPCKLTDSTFIITYGSSNGWSVIGTVDGKLVMYSEEFVFNSGATSDIFSASLTPTKFVVVYMDTGTGDSNVRVGSVDEGVITFGSVFEYNPSPSEHISVCSVSESKVVVMYQTVGGNQGNARVGDVTGNNITFGSSYVFNPGSSYYTSSCALNETTFVVVYRDQGNGGHGTAVVGFVAGDVVEFGVEYVFNPTQTGGMSCVRLSDESFVVTFVDASNSYFLTSTIGMISGNTIALGPENPFISSVASEVSSSVLTGSSFLVAYPYINSKIGKSYVGTISGSSVSYGSHSVFAPDSASFVSVVSLSDTSYVVSYADNGNSLRGSCMVRSIHDSDVVSVSEGSVVGVALDDGCAGEEVSVVVHGECCDCLGIDTLVSGVPVFVDLDGSLVSGLVYFDDRQRYVYIGLATASSSMFVNYPPSAIPGYEG